MTYLDGDDTVYAAVQAACTFLWEDSSSQDLEDRDPTEVVGRQETLDILLSQRPVSIPFISFPAGSGVLHNATTGTLMHAEADEECTRRSLMLCRGEYCLMVLYNLPV